MTIPSLHDVVIDIRHPTEAEDAPLVLTNNAVETIPFYELDSRIADITQKYPAQRVLLYCQKGTMSKIHAHHLSSAVTAGIGVLVES